MMIAGANKACVLYTKDGIKLGKCACTNWDLYKTGHSDAVTAKCLFHTFYDILFGMYSSAGVSYSVIAMYQKPPLKLRNTRMMNIFPK